MTSRYQVMIVTSSLVLRKARVLTRTVTGLKEGNKMATLKPIGKHYSAFKIQTNVITQMRISDALNSSGRCGEPLPYL